MSGSRPMSADQQLRERINRIRWHHSFEVVPGIMTLGNYKPDGLWKRLRIGDLRGKRLLDVGARDGFFSLKAIDAGADVVAVDVERADIMGFALTMELNGRKPEFVQASLYDLPARRLGSFEIIFCLGVLYHIPDPHLAIRILRALIAAGGKLYLESTNLAGMVASDGTVAIPEHLYHLPLALFSRRNTTSFWDMTPACMRRILEDNSFRIAREECWGSRVLFEATPA